MLGNFLAVHRTLNIVDEPPLLLDELDSCLNVYTFFLVIYIFRLHVRHSVKVCRLFTGRLSTVCLNLVA